ncbi:hypothetical protein SKAU_G00036880 [Synaphobranchus kaupii]|uniref:Uncharacterized protein n=1 Tax=Synaphobranchus kaupii TaxID=118154 RepID=A0A9Q1GEY5_SYNKA|nr:hypothetical protein SKAU_G00036880 [Synaphobranchus kaupii]
MSPITLWAFSFSNQWKRGARRFPLPPFCRSRSGPARGNRRSERKAAGCITAAALAVCKRLRAHFSGKLTLDKYPQESTRVSGGYGMALGSDGARRSERDAVTRGGESHLPPWRRMQGSRWPG